MMHSNAEDMLIHQPLPPTLSESDDMWGDISTEEEHALFDYTFDPNEDFLSIGVSEEEEHAFADENGARKRLQNSSGSRDAKRRKSPEYAMMQDNNCDMSVASDARTDISVQSAQLPFLTSTELDQKLEQSVSRLAQSMKRSEMSRQRVLEHGSSVSTATFGLSNLFGVGAHSTLGASISQSRSHFRSYINNVGHNTI
mmetsp:Transcript_3842/g.5780  ORF Transcript_3842/g.5780 Transcript_3842/m.5780 type:complete len:198 (-) Transcript_3842:145-738(-)|eukprot:CAMPEP_0197236750 /NCGR_PEP_ID=MMETSP1429-20130617/3775_1 /TAXON_ID=49237 /ORGANISM="Chaetoceros  sp., Strain UNC1202" /LENGTH=197 /DNA_ID=CAMNT_0042695617 /DNA_START=13 /DNA_END=606 /DNA_ORIENTATION=-